MSDFLELVETIKAEEVSAARIYGGDGNSVRGLRRENPRYLNALAEAAALIGDVYAGRKPMYRLQEAMSTSDFPLLFGDTIDRQLLPAYNDWPVVWPSIARRGTVRDFRAVKRFAIDGGEAALTAVKELTEYPAANLVDSSYSYSLTKYGKRLPFSWEAQIDDDLDALRNMPARLAKSARVSEERFVTTLYANNTTFFASGNKNVVTANPVLSIAGLTTAYQTLMNQVDTDGNPIYVDAVYLVVPPALKITANNIVNATEILGASGGGVGTGQDALRVNNWMAGIAKVIVNPWLPILDATHGSTGWYLFGDASDGRPTMELGFLAGHLTPEIFVKSANSTLVGGGVVGAESGDFDRDAIDYKVRHVFGGTMLDPKGAAYSNGSGS